MKTITGKLFQSAVLATALFTTSHYALAADMPGMPMNHDAMHPTDSKAVQAVGIIKAIDTKAGTVILEHEAIPAIKWPAMTMRFKVAGNAADHVSVGKKVVFELTGTGNDMTVVSMKPAN